MTVVSEPVYNRFMSNTTCVGLTAKTEIFMDILKEIRDYIRVCGSK